MDKDLRSISAETILIICQECRKQLVNDLEQILQATLWLDQMEAGSEPAQYLLKGNRFHTNERMQFLVCSSFSEVNLAFNINNGYSSVFKITLRTTNSILN